MTSTLSVSDAKARLFEVVKRASRGEQFIILSMGEPVARICPFEAARRPRQLGILAGQIRIAPDFDQWPDDIATAFGVSQPE